MFFLPGLEFVSRDPLVHFLIRTARSVMAMKFVNALHMLIGELPRPTLLKAAALVPSSWIELDRCRGFIQ